MAPGGVFHGVQAFVQAFNEDGCSSTAHIEGLIKANGGSIVKRLSAATHLVWSNGDARVLAEAKELKKRVAMPTWVEICIAAGERVSTQAFQPAIDPIIVPTTTATGRRKSVVVGGNKRPRTGKRSLETVPNGE